MSEIAERLDDDKQSSKNSMSREMSNESENQSHPPTLTHNDYTVGWICALPKEFAVAVAMVDQIHPDLPSMPGDTCTYRVGSIGKHNVVIACLPKGGIGNNPAAVVAIQIKRSFSSIRVGLMVGIGGGIPTKVKLGDVVISTPVDVYLGVVQWNLDKTEKNETFKRTGALNSPPKALLTAVSTMEGMNTIKECEIPRYLEEMGKKWPKSVQRYSKPLPSGLANSNNDWNVPRDVISVLWGTILALLGYLLGWEILAPTARGGELAGSDGDQEQQEEIVVHYGLIPSGNQVIKNAKCRDKINERVGGNVLCIEMEAAGLMKDFPCIVIRGICDYTDEQKNKNWQEYAAAVAAACAKELLGYVQPSLVAEERPLRDILSKG
jgi:nucleoside phosphorylase